MKAASDTFEETRTNQWAHLTISGEDPGGAWGDGSAATTLGQGPGCAAQHVCRGFCFPSETGFCLFLDKDKHALETHLLIIRGKRGSRDSQLHCADGQKGVSGNEKVFLGRRADALLWADPGGLLVLPGSLA